MPDQLTSTGLSIDDYQTRRNDVVTSLRATISPILDCSPEQPTGQIVDILLERLQETIELLQIIYSSFDSRQATGQSLDAVCSITGTYRNPATYGTVTLTVNLNAVTTIPAGSIVAVSGDADNQWATIADVTSVGAGNYTVDAQCMSTGPVQALAGTLTVIVTPVAGWNSVTNASDADVGEDEETDASLRQRREIEVTLGGSTSVDAIQAALSAIDGIISVYVYENDLNVSTGGMPPHSIEAVIWDGSPAVVSNAEIAEVIFNEKAGGVQSYGSLVAIHDDDQGNEHYIYFTRATQRRLQLEYTLSKGPGYPGDATFAAAMAILDDTYQGIGDDVFQSRWVSNAYTVPGVLNVTLMRLRWFGGAFGTADLSVTDREIARLDSADVTVI